MWETPPAKASLRLRGMRYCARAGLEIVAAARLIFQATTLLRLLSRTLQSVRGLKSVALGDEAYPLYLLTSRILGCRVGGKISKH